MTIRCKKHFLLAAIVLLTACTRQAQAVPSIATLPPPAATPIRQDAALFGAIPQGEIQAYSFEPVASAIFNKVMDAFIANGGILEYQVTRVAIFPADGGTLYAEITYNVRAADPAWLADGGTQADDNWINGKCNRFDFVTTETEFQLKNRRTCN